MNRKSAPKVRNGRVLKKNNQELTGDCYHGCILGRGSFQFIRERPGAGYRHLLQNVDIYRFLELLPEWEELTIGLNAVVLAPGDPGMFGYHVPGVIHICAWPRDLWETYSPVGYEKAGEFLERLEVPCERRQGNVICKFTEGTARAHQLLGTFLHELGHHHDRMTTKTKVRTGRGEPYAEEYARKYMTLIWDRYLTEFGLP